jgi:hypothetical protein
MAPSGARSLVRALESLVVSGAIFVDHGDLTGQAVAACVHAGMLFALFRFGSCGQKGVGAVGFELFVGDHVFLDSDVPRRSRKSFARAGGNGDGGGAGVLQGLGMREIWIYFCGL